MYFLSEISKFSFFEYFRRRQKICCKRQASLLPHLLLLPSSRSPILLLHFSNISLIFLQYFFLYFRRRQKTCCKRQASLLPHPLLLPSSLSPKTSALAHSLKLWLNTRESSVGRFTLSWSLQLLWCLAISWLPPDIFENVPFRWWGCF